jgi:hypothetical protein
MDVRLDAESSELVEHYLRKGGYDTPADLIHAALTYFAMRPEDWKRIGQLAEVGPSSSRRETTSSSNLTKP